MVILCLGKAPLFLDKACLLSLTILLLVENILLSFSFILLLLNLKAVKIRITTFYLPFEVLLWYIAALLAVILPFSMLSGVLSLGKDSFSRDNPVKASDKCKGLIGKRGNETQSVIVQVLLAALSDVLY